MSDIYFAKTVGNVIRIVDAMTGVTAGQISIRGNVTRDPIVQQRLEARPTVMFIKFLQVH